MATYLALLRAVNIGSHKKVAMADLRDFLTELGFDDPRTFLNSGNTVFGAMRTTPAALERRLEAEAKTRLGLDTPFFVRTVPEWQKAITENPFPAEARDDPSHLVVLFMKAAPTRAAVKTLQAAITGREVVRTKGRQAYIVYPSGIGTSRLTGALLDRKLGVSGTGRNWNTVLKLERLAAEA